MNVTDPSFTDLPNGSRQHMPVQFPCPIQMKKLNLVPGAIGSIDCVHVGWDMCPASIRSDCEGKEGYLTLAFKVVVSHTRKILACSEAFYGTWND